MDYPLLKIRHDSKWMLLFLIPTLYGCWMYNMNQLVTGNKSTKSFLSFIILSVTAIISLSCIVIPVIWINFIPGLNDYLYLVPLLYLVRLFVSIMITQQSFLFEDKKNLRIIPYKPGLKAYITRIFILQHWYIGIFSFQQIANHYIETSFLLMQRSESTTKLCDNALNAEP